MTGVTDPELFISEVRLGHPLLKTGHPPLQSEQQQKKLVGKHKQEIAHAIWVSNDRKFSKHSQERFPGVIRTMNRAIDPKI